ncbi:MAG TPA: hypothetical protein EYQ18_05820 [Candidatus Handelsmanbacteria bacterium]|nr:hypothetical protein [Candidatus Handelsmanbacteria bacterium]
MQAAIGGGDLAVETSLSVFDGEIERIVAAQAVLQSAKDAEPKLGRLRYEELKPAKTRDGFSGFVIRWR